MKNSTKLKIGLVLDDSLDRSQNGVQQYVNSLGTWLTSCGHTVHYLAGETQNNERTIHSLSRNIRVRFNKNRLSIPLPADKRVIKQLLEREKYDVLHVQMPYSPFLAGRIIAAAPLDTAVVGTFHILPFGALQGYGSKALGLVQKAGLRRFDAICSVSEAARTFARSHFGLHSTVIPNMIETARFESTHRNKPGRVVFLGRLVPRKGCKEFLAAVAALPPELQDRIDVVVASDGPERRSLEAYALAHKLPVNFVGFINESQKVDLLASAELAVFPSLGGESFGIVLIEAMAAGAGIVLGGNNPGYTSVLGPWPKTLIDPRDTALFARRMKYFLQDGAARKQIHIQQQEAVRQYDTNVAGKTILRMYRTALLHRSQEVR